MMTSTKKQKPQVKRYDTNPIEALRDIPQGVASSFANDLAKGGMSDFFGQLFGEGPEAIKKNETKGELRPGQEISLSGLKHQKEEQRPRLDILPGIDYRRDILYGRERIAKEQTHEVEVKLHEIIIELKRLAASSKDLQVQFKEATTEQRITKPGKYHLNFFEWLLSVIRDARLKVEDSGAWLAAMKSKKSSKKYWNMFKKHGTTFGLSNERVVATQTG